MQGKPREPDKKRAHGGSRNVSIQQWAISLSDFQQPMGMQLREDNRWVKKAQMIPWDKIEAKYADLFPSGTGNVAKPLQLALI